MGYSPFREKFPDMTVCCNKKCFFLEQHQSIAFFKKGLIERIVKRAETFSYYVICVYEQDVINCYFFAPKLQLPATEILYLQFIEHLHRK